MKKDTGIYGTAAGMIQTGSFGARLFGYAIFYIPITLVYVILLMTPEAKQLKVLFEFVPKGGFFADAIALFIVFAPTAVPFILWEKSIRKFRRKNGLSVYGDIKEELEQREINERVAKEHKAFVANGIAGADSGKKDLDYWFGLLQKGAITEDEYNVKKSELMAV